MIINSVLNHTVVTRLAETVKFNIYNFVESYDKKVFTEKEKKSFLIGGMPCSVIIKKTFDLTLQNYAIIKMKFDNKSFISFVKTEHLSQIEKQTSINDPNEWLNILNKLTKASRQLGPKVNQTVKMTKNYIQTLEDKKERLIQNIQIMEMACLNADQLAGDFFSKEINIKKEMTDCGLDAEQIKLIHQHSVGVYDVIEFLQTVAPKLLKESTLIGLNHKNIIPAFEELLKCEDYIDAYIRLYGDIIAQPDFLERLTNDGHPIIFFVPHKLFGDKQGVTADEMRWLLANPKKMESVYFVFRSYKIYSNKVIKSTGLKDTKEIECYTEVLTKRIFKQLQNQCSLTSKNYKISILKTQAILQNYESIRLHYFEEPEKSVFIQEVCSEVCVSLPALPSISRIIPVFERNKAIFLMGGAGAGKGTIRSAIVEKHPERNYVIIDPDLIKTTISAYQKAVNSDDKNAGTLVHQESVQKADALLALMVNKGTNFIYDASGSRIWTYEKQMSAAKEKGMDVKLIYVATSVEICLQRIQERGGKEKRFVPEKVVRSTNEYAEMNFDELKPLAHKWRKYKNDDDTPKLVETNK